MIHNFSIVIMLLVGQFAYAQAPSNQSFTAGQPLGVIVDGTYTPISNNVTVYGAFSFAESCSYDATRGLIVVPNRGAPQNAIPNDGYVSLINHDGSVHTSRWIGVNRNGLTLNDPLGSDIHNGILYVADIDGGTSSGEPRVAVIRKFDMKTGALVGEFRNPNSTFLNDVAIAEDGTIYATQTGARGEGADPTTWKVYKFTPDGEIHDFVVGPPLFRPNGVAMDNDGNIVVVNLQSNDVLTFSPAGVLVKTEKAVQAGNDGLVIMEDGTKYVGSVFFGGVSRIRPGQPAEMIASGIPSGASMCFDSDANQLVIPMNPNNAIALITLD